MSSFLMNDEHLCQMAFGLFQGSSDDSKLVFLLGKKPDGIVSERVLAEALHKMNLDAVNARYSENNEDAFSYERVDLPSVKTLCEHVQCWLCQCCQTDEIMNSDLYLWVSKASEHLEKSVKDLKMEKAKEEGKRRHQLNIEREKKIPSIEAKNPSGLLYIVAEYRINESNGYEDHYDSFKKRSILIGIEGKRVTEKLLRRHVKRHDFFSEFSFRFIPGSSSRYGRERELIEESEKKTYLHENSTGWHIRAHDPSFPPGIDED